MVIEDRPEGRTLVVTGDWTAGAERVVTGGEVDGLWLNYARGFSEPTLDFLDAWPLRRLLVLDRSLEDLSPVARLADTLESLSVQAAPGATVDLGELPHLTHLDGYWDIFSETIDAAVGLRELHAFEFDRDDLTALRGNAALKTVVVKLAPRLESLAGIDGLPSLRKLAVFGARRLADITDVSPLAASIREFELEACPRVDSLDAVTPLAVLTWLGVSDCQEIDSLRPLAGLNDLEVLYAFGTTRVVDNDLSPLTRLPRLREIRMKDRREYKPRLFEVQARLDQTGP